MRISILIFIYTVHFAYLKVYTKFENTGSNRSWEIYDRNFHWRERKMNKKRTDKQYVAVFSYTIQLITINLCTKFQNPNSSSCWEIFDEKSLQKDKPTHEQTNIITEKAKTIYSLYTSYLGNNIHADYIVRRFMLISWRYCKLLTRNYVFLKFLFQTIVLQFNYKYLRRVSFQCQSNKDIDDSNDPNKQITLHCHFLRHICMIPFPLSSKTWNLLSKICNMSSSTRTQSSWTSNGLSSYDGPNGSP